MTAAEVINAIMVLITAAWTVYQEYRHRTKEKEKEIIYASTAMDMGTAPNGSTDLQVVQIPK